MSKDKIHQTARLYALQNAVQFTGKAHPKAVIGKVIAVCKKENISPKEIIPVVHKLVKEINSLSLEEQRRLLAKEAPELLHKEKQERDFSLPELEFAEPGKVITRFPPEPNGFLHIGHAKAAFIDYEYAKKYDGTFILRFDDTNPENAQSMFYDAQKEDLQWLGISWDKEYCTSSNLPTHYKLAEQLIEQGDAYLCRCAADDIKHGRYHAKACSCRDKSKGSMIDTWHEFINGGEEGGILRLKGDMQSVNTAMRDPTLFRVIDAEHPLQGTKYRVWPTYDFAGAVEDSISGVTHPFRTKEYELRDAVYFHLLSLLKLRKPHLMEFARLSIKGMPVSKRKIKPLIDQGIVSGYDDPRLPTLRGLQRRGIVPEAIKQFVIEQGLSKVESTVDFSVLEAVNRKHLDPQVKRFFFVPDPHKLEVTKAPKTTVDLPFHPTEKLGTRKVQTESTFYIPGDEATQFKKGDIFRLKELYNVTVLLTGKSLKVQYAGKDILPNTKKLQWVTDNSIPFSILKPGLLFKGDTVDKESMQTITGRAEQAIQTVSPGEIIQFERVGFTRIETTDANQQQGIFAHK